MSDNLVDFAKSKAGYRFKELQKIVNSIPECRAVKMVEETVLKILGAAQRSTKVITIVSASIILSGCYGTANIIDRGNVKEIVYSGFVDSPASMDNSTVMQTLSNRQCPQGYKIVRQSQKSSHPRNIIWVIGCEQTSRKEN